MRRVAERPQVNAGLRGHAHRGTQVGGDDKGVLVKRFALVASRVTQTTGN